MQTFRHDRARQSLPPARIFQQHPLKLVDVIDRACRVADVAPSRFGRDAANDPALVGDIRAGRYPGKRIRARIIAHADRLTFGKAVRHG